MPGVEFARVLRYLVNPLRDHVAQMVQKAPPLYQVQNRQRLRGCSAGVRMAKQDAEHYDIVPLGIGNVLRIGIPPFP